MLPHSHAGKLTMKLFSFIAIVNVPQGIASAMSENCGQIDELAISTEAEVGQDYYE